MSLSISQKCLVSKLQMFLSNGTFFGTEEVRTKVISKYCMKWTVTNVYAITLHKTLFHIWHDIHVCHLWHLCLALFWTFMGGKRKRIIIFVAKLEKTKGKRGTKNSKKLMLLQAYPHKWIFVKSFHNSLLYWFFSVMLL